jgi:hypothetical protein
MGENRGTDNRWCDLLEQLEPFAAHLVLEAREAGDAVLSRACSGSPAEKRTSNWTLHPSIHPSSERLPERRDAVLTFFIALGDAHQDADAVDLRLLRAPGNRPRSGSAA